MVICQSKSDYIFLNLLKVKLSGNPLLYMGFLLEGYIKQDDRIYVSIIFFIIELLLYWVIVVAVHQIYRKCTFYHKTGKYFFYTHIYSVYFFFMPSFLYMIIRVAGCRQIGSEEYVKGDLMQHCHSKQRLQYLNVFLLIITGIYFIIFPVFIINSLKKNKAVLYSDKNIMQKMGYLYLEYKPKYFLWEWTRYVVMALVVIFSCFYEEIKEISSISILLILSIYIQTLKRYSPHRDKKILEIELMSMHLLQLIILLNIFHSSSAEVSIKAITSFIIQAITTLFYIYTFIRVAVSFDIRIKNYVQELVLKLSKNILLLDLFFQSINLKYSDRQKIYRFWSQLRNYSKYFIWWKKYYALKRKKILIVLGTHSSGKQAQFSQQTYYCE